MGLHYGFTKYFLLFALVDRALLVPAPVPRSTIGNQQGPSKLVEIKLPIKITSMEDLVAWARNAMRTMASRIDITLASIDDPVDSSGEKVDSSANSENRQKHRESGSSSYGGNRERVHSPVPIEKRPRSREPVPLSYESSRPGASSALLSTFVNLLNTDNSFDSGFFNDQDDVARNPLPYGNFNAYLPLLLDGVEISKHREEALRKYYNEKDQANREKERKEIKDRKGTRYPQAIAQQTSNVQVSNNEIQAPLEKNQKNSEKLTPVISVPFEAVVTITRENVAEPTRQSFEAARDPPDDFPPYFEKDYPRGDRPAVNETNKKSKVTSEKRQIASIGELLRILGLTKRFTTKKKEGEPLRGSNAQTSNTRTRKPSEKFTPPPVIQFEDEPPRPRRNETSQRQEIDEEEEEEGSLGSLTGLLPLVIPILEDLSDPESDADLGEVLEAAIPLLEGLFDNTDPDNPGILEQIGPVLMTILGGKDGMGSDVGALLGPLLQVLGPLIGPLSGPLFAAISGPNNAGGSSVASLIQAVIGPLAQPGPDGKSPLSTITASVLAAVIKDLKIGQPGGLDIGALVGGVLSGASAGTSAGLSGSSSGDSMKPQPYGPYGPGPAQAGSVNNRVSAGQPINSLHQRHPINQQQIAAPVNVVEHQRIVNHPTQTSYATLPQKLHPAGTHPQFQNYAQQQFTGPVQAGTTNGDDGGSSYLPYGNNAVPASNANPLGLVTDAIKDIFGGGVNLISSLVGAVFGISGSSSAEEKPPPVYGPPAQGYH